MQSIPAELARDVKGMQEPETPLGWLGLDLQLRLQRDLLETYFSAEPPAPPHVVLAKGGADGQQVQARLGIGEDTLRPKTPALRPNPRGPSRVFRPAAPPNPPNAPCCRTPPRVLFTFRAQVSFTAIRWNGIRIRDALLTPPSW